MFLLAEPYDIVESVRRMTYPLGLLNPHADTVNTPVVTAVNPCDVRGSVIALSQ